MELHVFPIPHQYHTPQNTKLINWVILKLKTVSFGEDTLQRIKRKTTNKEKDLQNMYSIKDLCPKYTQTS